MHEPTVRAQGTKVSAAEAFARLGRYTVRLARDAGDVDAVLRMRFEVFNVELNEGLDTSWATGRDEDPFDAVCDHLLVEDRTTGAVVGAYRLQTWEAATRGIGFYSAGEFDLSGLPDGVLRQSVEIGRACVARAYRNRRVLFLLWRGLAAYVLGRDKRYLFGCSSLTSQDPALGLRAYADLCDAGHLHRTFMVEPIPGTTCDDDGSWRERPAVSLPILFRTYLRYGAKICGPPAIDRAFKTIDFLMLLDIAEVDPEVLEMFTDGDDAANGRGAS